MTDADTRTLTAEEFAHLRDWKDFELHDGRLVPFRCGAEASHVGGILASALFTWGGRRRVWVFGTGASYGCFPGHPDTVRRPRVSVIRTDRLRRDQIPSIGHFAIAPDVAAEVVTPWHTYEEVEAKVADYRSAGVKLIWVVSPKSRTVLIRRLDGTCAEVGEAGQLSGEDVIPGFACPVAELFV